MEPPGNDAWRQEDFFRDENYVCGRNAHGGVFARRARAKDILWVLVVKEATGEDFLACFRQALDAGVVELSIPTLVDLTRFTGAVDWAAIRAVRDMAAWGRGAKRKSRVAYVVRDDQSAALVKIVAALFPRSRHRPFYNLEHALFWLSSPDGGELPRR